VKQAVNCATHGEQGLAIVCVHSIQSMNDGIRRGLFWSVDGDGDVNAYCDICAEYLASNGDEWPEKYMEFVQGKVLCLQCFERLKQINERVM
jgi:hypothetical protein